MERQLRKRIYIFTFIIIFCGWFGKFIDTILVNQPKGQSLGSLIWLVTPFIAALLFAKLKKSKWRTVGLKPYLKGNVRWYALSLLLYPICMVLLLGIGSVFKLVDFSHFVLKEFTLSFGVWFLSNFFRTILEETAWRGFLVERLIKLHTNDFLIYIITALIWSTWHVPYYLFFYPNGNAGYLIISGYIIMFCWSILFTEIYRITRCIWPCVLLHATANAVQYTIMEDHFRINASWNILISPANGIIACAICVVIGFLIRNYRINHMKAF